MNRLPFDVAYQIIAELCTMYLSDHSGDAEDNRFHHTQLWFQTTKWASKSRLGLAQQLLRLRLVCKAFACPALIHMTKHIPLTFSNPERWLTMVSYWKDRKDKCDVLDRLEKLSVTIRMCNLFEAFDEYDDGDDLAAPEKKYNHPFYATVRHLMGNLIISNNNNNNNDVVTEDGTQSTKAQVSFFPGIKQIYLDLTRLSLEPRNSRLNLTNGLAQAFRLGFNGQLTTLHIIARERILFSLLRNALQDPHNRLCANLEELSIKYIVYLDEKEEKKYHQKPGERDWQMRRVPLVIPVAAKFSTVPNDTDAVGTIRRKTLVSSRFESVENLTEMFIERCPKLKRLDVYRPRESPSVFKLHPLAAERGLDELNVTGMYTTVSGPPCIAMALGGMATERTEIRLRDLEVMARDLEYPYILRRRPLDADWPCQRWCLDVQEMTGCRSLKVFKADDMVLEVLSVGDKVIIRRGK